MRNMNGGVGQRSQRNFNLEAENNGNIGGGGNFEWVCESLLDMQCLKEKTKGTFKYHWFFLFFLKEIIYMWWLPFHTCDD